MARFPSSDLFNSPISTLSTQVSQKPKLPKRKPATEVAVPRAVAEAVAAVLGEAPPAPEEKPKRPKCHHCGKWGHQPENWHHAHFVRLSPLATGSIVQLAGVDNNRVSKPKKKNDKKKKKDKKKDKKKYKKKYKDKE
ncbi:hypothetical protein ACJ41O_009679 [Fusarium nematophilum]